jgi:gluconokinase
MLHAVEQPLPAPLRYASLPSPPPEPSAAVPASSSSHLTSDNPPTMAIPPRHHILIVTGPAGCGKSTVAKLLADRYAFNYIEGDEFHPKANIDKMAAGVPLNDADRWDWLILLRDQALQDLKNGAKGVVVTCSALKKKYRDVIRTARLYDEDPNANVHFVYLRADKQTLLDRVRARQGHYMKDAMVDSQFAALEEPDEAEIKQLKDVEIVNVTGTLAEVQNLATAAVDKVLVSR